MVKHIHKCLNCNSYTLKDICPKCSIKTQIPKPPKFSLEDKYANYKRQAKIKDLQEKGLI